MDDSLPFLPPNHQSPTSSQSSASEPHGVAIMVAVGSAVAGNHHMPSSTSAGRHPVYRGVRCRGVKWVSEIREPGKAKRIWLGTYHLPEMAAIAYDVASLTLKGSDAVLNFPDSVRSHPIPASASPSDIQAAAAEAADAFVQKKLQISTEEGGQVWGNIGDQFMDEEEMYNMPKFLENMAEAMLMSPPRMSPVAPDDSPKASDCDGVLWNHDL